MTTQPLTTEQVLNNQTITNQPATNRTTNRFPIHRDPSGRALLNLACGTRTDWTWNNLDFSPYATLRRHPLLASVMYAVGLLSDQRLERLETIDPGIIRWNLARGIPFEDASFDLVYHSHFLEHLDRLVAVRHLRECQRVLKPGGILRIVVPDLEAIVRKYCETMEEPDAHEHAIKQLFDQMVRTESTGPNEQKPWVRRVERLLRGNPYSTGENHRWMYDRHTLGRVLTELGFEEVSTHVAATSAIAGWEKFCLDLNPDGTPYKSDSLYMEARKAAA
jgi:SAM-dependent methyltransferase